jgi:glycine/D-amino acid oxidase-like deaminating enzyme
MTRYATVVIGAGIVGCLVARELADRDPQATVAVLDRDAAGAGASRRSAGLHLPRGATPRLRRMSTFSHAYYADLLGRHPELPIHPVRATVITGGGTRGEALRGHYLAEAAPVRLDTPPAAPGGGAVGGGGPDPGTAWRISGAHYCDVHQLTQALAAQLRPRVSFREGVAVTGLEPAGDAVTVHTGTGERLTAGTVVLAPGPWLAAPAWRGLTAPLGLRVKKVAALHIEQRPGPADEALVLDRDDAFLLPLAQRGHWLLSYHCPHWDVDPDRLTAGLLATDTAVAGTLLRRYAPALAGACLGGRVFCDAYSPGGEPVIRALDDAGRVVFAGAANGSGYRLAPAIAAEAAGLVLAARGQTAGQRPRKCPGQQLPGQELPGQELPVQEFPGQQRPSQPPQPPGPPRRRAPRSEGVTSDHQYV